MTKPLNLNELRKIDRIIPLCAADRYILASHRNIDVTYSDIYYLIIKKVEARLRLFRSNKALNQPCSTSS